MNFGKVPKGGRIIFNPKIYAADFGNFKQVRESVPIKCMEAVILAIYLTNGIPGLGR